MTPALKRYYKEMLLLTSGGLLIAFIVIVLNIVAFPNNVISSYQTNDPAALRLYLRDCMKQGYPSVRYKKPFFYATCYKDTHYVPDAP